MMVLTLFDLTTGALYRRRDPVTSRQAAQQHDASGRTETNRARVLEGVRQYPGLSSKDLAERIGMERVEVGRRASDLKSSGAIYEAGQSATGVRLWPA